MNKQRKWDAELLGPLTLEAVKGQHQPAYKFRVHQYRHGVHTPFSGGAVAHTLYVISGTCLVTIQATAESCTLAAGEFLVMPEGSYIMAFPEPVEIIKVLELPPAAWPQEHAQSGKG